MYTLRTRFIILNTKKDFKSSESRTPFLKVCDKGIILIRKQVKNFVTSIMKIEKEYNGRLRSLLKTTRGQQKDNSKGVDVRTVPVR